MPCTSPTNITLLLLVSESGRQTISTTRNDACRYALKLTSDSESTRVCVVILSKSGKSTRSE